MKKLFAGAAVAAAVAAIVATVSAAGGPPQFLTFPILMHVGEDGLDHGHFVFTEGAAIPTPLAQDLGSTTYAPSASAGSLLDPTPNPNIDVSKSWDSYEGETGATSAATANNLIVAGSNHIYPGNCSAAAASGSFGDCAPLAYVSSDGVIFDKMALPRTWTSPVGNSTTFGIGFDPAVDVSKPNATTNLSTFYYSYGVAPLTGNYPNAIVFVSSADGVHWSQKTPVTFNTNKNFDDKYYLAVDRTAAGAYANRIYVSWDRNQANNQILYIAYSSNGGSSWSAPIKVDDGKTKFERVIGAYPAVDQNSGVVYDSWHNYAKNIIYVDKSTNGGSSWGTDVAAATTHAGFGQDIGCVGGRAQGPAHALKVGSNHELYLVYADPVSTAGPGGINHRFDILFTKSTNGGATWSTPKSINDDGGTADQFHPTLSVESNGTGGDKVTVTFYDRRDDPNNCLAHVYATQSTDGGATWSTNVKQTSEPSDFTGNANGPGDYSSSTPWSSLSAVFPFFSDHRATNFANETGNAGAFEVYTVKVQ